MKHGGNSHSQNWQPLLASDITQAKSAYLKKLVNFIHADRLFYKNLTQENSNHMNKLLFKTVTLCALLAKLNKKGKER